jgi:hypothetical protein
MQLVRTAAFLLAVKLKSRGHDKAKERFQSKPAKGGSLLDSNDVVQGCKDVWMAGKLNRWIARPITT